MNAKDFRKRAELFVKKDVPEAHQRLHLAVARHLFHGIVRRTPVAPPGDKHPTLLRGSMRAALEPVTETPDPNKPFHEVPDDTVFDAGTAGHEPYQTIHVGSGLDYAAANDDGIHEGSDGRKKGSEQAPLGMSAPATEATVKEFGGVR